MAKTRRQVIIGVRTLAPANAGGPATAARLLAEGVLARNAENVAGLALINTEVASLESLLVWQPNNTAPLNGPADRARWALGRNPDSYALNRLQSIVRWARGQRIGHSLRRVDATGQNSVLIGFGFPTIYQASKMLFGDLPILVHSEHSKGGPSREMTMAQGGKTDRLTEAWRDVEVTTIRAAARVVFPSKGALDLFSEWHPECRSEVEGKGIIVYNGIPDPLVAAVPRTTEPGCQSLVYVAEHVPEKRVDRFVGAAANLIRTFAERGKCLRAVNIGAPGPETMRIKDTAADLGGGQIAMLGSMPRAEVLGAIANSSLVIHCPDVAVFDLALLEAMGMGKPIIATPVGGNIEALGQDYPLFASTDAEIAEKGRWVLGNPGEAEAIASRNRKRFLSKFTSEAMTENYLAEMERLCNTRRA